MNSELCNVFGIIFSESGFPTFIWIFKHLYLWVDRTFNSKILCQVSPTNNLQPTPSYLAFYAMSRIKADILNVSLGYMGQSIQEWTKWNLWKVALKIFEVICFASADHITSNFLKALFQKFKLVHSWISCLKMSHFDRYYVFKTELFCFKSDYLVIL